MLSPKPHVTLFGDRVFNVKWGLRVDPNSALLASLWKGGADLSTDISTEGRWMKRSGDKAIHKPRTDSWDRFFPRSPQKKPNLQTLWSQASSLPSYQKYSSAFEVTQSVVHCYGSSSCLTHRPAFPSHGILSSPSKGLSSWTAHIYIIFFFINSSGDYYGHYSLRTTIYFLFYFILFF